MIPFDWFSETPGFVLSSNYAMKVKKTKKNRREEVIIQLHGLPQRLMEAKSETDNGA
jgi:hypothetical protein